MLIRNDTELYWRTANIFPAGLSNRHLAIFVVASRGVMRLLMFIARLGR